jgi:microcystin-dependent protein
MSNPFVAEIRIFPFNFAPTGWALCNGQLLPISQNTALFSLLGTTFGGNGTSTFGLPNLQGSVPMHWGQGPGLTAHVEGETGGSSTVTLINAQLPAHTHVLQGFASRFHEEPLAAPANNALTVSGTSIYDPAVPSSPAVMNANSVAPAGGGAPHNNMMPYLTLSICIALQGVFPSRN